MLVRLLMISLGTCVAYNNGMGRKPPMGWQTWCSVSECGEDHCFDGQIRAMADTLVSSGMKDLGYEWVILDDCWHPSRDSNGTLVPFPRFFPPSSRPFPATFRQPLAQFPRPLFPRAASSILALALRPHSVGRRVGMEGAGGKERAGHGRAECAGAEEWAKE